MGAFVKTPMIKRVLSVALAAAFIGGLSGCASTANNPKDPYEGFNRAMFSVNEGFDVVLKPVAEGYDAAAPLPVKAGIGNFFGNISDAWTAINNFLQGKGSEGLSDVGRVLVNTTLGIGGVFDVAGAARRDSVGDHEMLLSESQARAFVAVPEAAVKAVFAAAEAEGVDAVRIGTSGGDMLAISGVDLLAAEGEGCGWIASIDELRELSDTGRTYF